MEQTEDYDNISPTAYFVADWRSMSDIEYAKDIAHILKAREVSERILGKGLLEKMCWFMAPMIEARHKSLRKVLNSLGSKNFYGLAEGALPTGLQMTQDADVKYVHSDLPKMLSEGERVIRQVMDLRGISRPNLKFSQVNAMDANQLKDAASFFNNEPFVMSCEGFMMYLGNAEREVMLPAIRNTLVENNGIAFATPDVFYRSGVKSTVEIFGHEYLGVLRSCLEIIAKRTGRSMRDNFFETADEAHAAIENAGFAWERRPFYDGSYELSCLASIPDYMHQKVIDFFSQRHVYIMRPSI